MHSSRPALSAEQLAALFTNLHQLESAGLPAFQAIDILMKSATELKAPLTLLQRQLKTGRPISEAAFRSGIFDDTLKALIHAAETGGRLAAVYGQLAAYYSALSARTKRVKSRLLMPALILMIALLVQPLPALVGAQIGIGGYLQLSLGRLAAIALAVFLLLRLPGILHGLGGGAAWDRALLGIPALARRIVARQLNEFFLILALLLESGLPFDEALRKSVATIENMALRDQFAPALAMSGSGSSVTDTLAQVAAINSTMLGVLDVGEKSGKLASGILHYAQLEAESISRQDDAFATWIPRVIYSLIAIWMAYSIVGSPLGTGATVMP